MTTVQVKFDDVIKIILQFLQQNKFSQTFHALQKQSNVSLNTIHKDKLASLINDNQWDLLLKQLNYLMPSQDTLFDLYQMIIDDLIQNDRFQAASFLIQKLLTPNKQFQQTYKERILRLQYICENQSQKALYKKPVTEQRKEGIIKRIVKETHQQIEKGRLLSLLTDAIRYQSQSGLIKPNISLSLYENKQKQLQVESQQIIKSVQKVIKYNEQTKISAIRVSNKGEYIALGGIDGLIEIYDPIDYSLHTGLSYQAQDIMMFHQNPVCSLQFNDTDELLASGDRKGCVKIWNMSTGKLLRKFNYSAASIGCMCWGNDPSHLLVGYQTISLYSIRSCIVIKQYNIQETQYLLSIFFNNQRLFSFSQSGRIKVFNYTTQEQLNSLLLKSPILKVCPMVDKGTDLLNFMVCTPKEIIEIGHRLEQNKNYTIIDGEYVNLGCIGAYLYECVRTHEKKYKLHVKDRKTSKIVHFTNIEEKIDSVSMLNFRNLLITYSESDSLEFWRP